MADLPVGTRGTLRITDDGSTVRFYVLCSDPSTSVGSYTGAMYVNGVNVPFNVSLGAGFGSRLLGAFNVSYAQNVGLAQNATGTAGLGKAASFGVYIYRATVPPAPTPAGLDQVTPTTMRYMFNSAGDGGSAITGWQAQRATDAAFTQNVQTVSSSGTTTFTGLSPATTYYFRARGTNALGTGAWSTTISDMTASGAYASINGDWVPVPMLYDPDGATWLDLAPLISNGTAWGQAI